MVKLFGRGWILLTSLCMVCRGRDGKVVVGDEYEQARMIFFKTKNLVEAAGGAMADDVVKVTIFVTDITQRETI